MKIVADSYMTIKIVKGRGFNNGGNEYDLTVSSDRGCLTVHLLQGTASGEKQLDELILALQGVR